MSDKLKPVRCGCGGEAMIDAYLGDLHRNNLYYIYCAKCDIRTSNYLSETEAIETWNVAMGAKDTNVLSKERTAKVVHSTTFGEWKNMCGHCFESGKKMGLFGGQKYCYECGTKLDWGDDE